MRIPAPFPLPETPERKCPYCGNRSVVGLGRIIAGVLGVRCDYRCPPCSEDFIFLP